MIVRRTNQMFGCALAASLVMHAALFAWFDHAIDEHQRSLASSRVEIVTIALPQYLQLGLEKPPEVSETWLGFEERQEQLAEPSETEQAAFADEPAAPPSQPIEAVQQLPRFETSELTQTVQQISKDVSEAVGSFAKEVRRLRSLLDVDPESSGAPQSNDDDVKQAEQKSADAPSGAESEQGESAPAPTTPPAPPPPSDQTGTLADKQSMPTSIIDVPPDQWKLGKPLASKGLELKPRRPTLTVLTMLTAAPGNPLCVIYFNREGVAVKAAILRSSGDNRVDSAILASLYGWRAAGKALETIRDEQPLEVTIRILLTRQRVDREA